MDEQIARTSADGRVDFAITQVQLGGGYGRAVAFDGSLGAFHGGLIGGDSCLDGFGR